MKSKSLIFNLLFGVMMAIFGVTLFVVLPPTGAGAQEDTASIQQPVASIVNPELTDVAVVTPADPVTNAINGMMSRWSLIVAGIVNVLVFLSGALPKFAIFKDDRKRDLLAKTLGAVLVAGIAVFTVGPANIWPVLSGFALAVFNYNNVLKPVVGGTKTVAAKAVK